MKYDASELLRLNATQSTFNCPICRNPLLFKTLEDGIKIWCPVGVCPSIGANEGGFGKNEKAAFDILTQKLTFGK